MHYTDHETLDALAARYGGIADWLAGDAEMLEATRRAQIEDALEYMSEEDKLILRLYGFDRITQVRLASMWQMARSSVSTRWSRAVRRLKYWLEFVEVSPSLGRTLREVGAPEADVVIMLDYLAGKTVREASGKPQTTGWDSINRVRKALRRSGSKRALRVIELMSLRGRYPRV